jgi:hypothetical protein
MFWLKQKHALLKKSFDKKGFCSHFGNPYLDSRLEGSRYVFTNPLHQYMFTERGNIKSEIREWLRAYFLKHLDDIVVDSELYLLYESFDYSDVMNVPEISYWKRRDLVTAKDNQNVCFMPLFKPEKTKKIVKRNLG